MSLNQTSRSWIACVLCAAVWVGLTLQAAPAPAKLTPGNGTLYIGAWPNKIFIIDEATQKVTGAMEMTTGVPHGGVLSSDGKRFYMTNADNEHVEILDLATRKSVDNFTLSEGRKRVMVSSLTPDPLHQFVVMLTRAREKLIDRWEISPATLIVYDLATHKVRETIPWPKDEERTNVSLMMSPDGKLLYFFAGQEVLIYSTTTWKQVDTWALGLPTEQGLGARFDFGSRETIYEEPGFYTSLFTVQDPVQNKRLMGIARVNLNAKTVQFWPIGPARSVGFAMTPDRKRAYGLASATGDSVTAKQAYEFWTFDLENHKVISKIEFAGRSRMSLRPSSNGKVLYVYAAGNTIDLYEAATGKYLQTTTFDGDSVVGSALYVIPPASSTPPRTSTR
jgi:DNA-binding beta-propeller fold protein YncE